VRVVDSARVAAAVAVVVLDVLTFVFVSLLSSLY